MILASVLCSALVVAGDPQDTSPKPAPATLEAYGPPKGKPARAPTPR